MTATPANATKTAIKSMIRKGYVLHMDPDYLLLTYGDITTGKMPRNTIGPRYAMCIGVEGEATFWALLSSQDNDTKQAIPEKAKAGAWADNGTASFFSKDGLWVMTRDMAIEAHSQVNAIRSTYKHSYVKPELITPWPSIPPTYPKNFTPLRQGPLGYPAPAPTTISEAVPEEPVSCPPEAVKPSVPDAMCEAIGVDRVAVGTRACRLLANARLTDAEVMGLMEDLERRVIAILLGE